MAPDEIQWMFPAGLFSAVSSAFIVSMEPSLTPNPNECSSQDID